MKRIGTFLALPALALLLTNTIGFAQDHHDDHPPQRDNPQRDNPQRDKPQHGTAQRYDSPRDNHRFVQHREWTRGARMNHDDWARGERLDYRRYHLNAPPNGYEWRHVDGNYVMAAVATGLIATVVVASAVR